MGLMSVARPLEQVRARQKSVTRRLGWRHVRVGEQIMLCEKAVGLQRGEDAERIVAVEVVSLRQEPVSAITADDVIAERFPCLNRQEFVAFFCATHRGVLPDTEVTRIHWRYLDDQPPSHAKRIE